MLRTVSGHSELVPEACALTVVGYRWRCKLRLERVGGHRTTEYSKKLSVKNRGPVAARPDF